MCMKKGQEVLKCISELECIGERGMGHGKLAQEDLNALCADLLGVIPSPGSSWRPSYSFGTRGSKESRVPIQWPGLPSPLLSARHGPYASVLKSESVPVFFVTRYPHVLCSRVHSSVPAFRILLGT